MVAVMSVVAVAAAALWFASQRKANHGGVVDAPDAAVRAMERPQSVSANAVHRKSDTASNVLAAQLRAALAEGRPIGVLLAEWMPHAGDDPALSMKLATELLECTALPANDEEFMARQPKLAPSERNRAADDLNRRAAICESVENAEQARYDLVRAAALAGDAGAQTSYAFFAGPYVHSEASMARDGIREEYKRDVARFAQAALASGSRSAYLNAHEVFSSDLLGHKDAVAAYAYLLKATESISPAIAEKMRAKASGSLSAEQLAQAQRMAAGLKSPVD